MANDKIFKSTCRQCITEIEPNNNAVEILELRVFDSATSVNIILAAIEAIDTAAITGAVDIDTILSAVEAVDVTGITAENLIAAYVTGNEALDTALIEVRAILTASLTSGDAVDTAEIDSTLDVSVTLEAQEQTDITEIEISTGVDRNATISAVENRDGVNIRISHPSARRDRTYVPLSRIAHIKHDNSLTAKMNVTEKADGCRIEIKTDIIPVIAASENRDGITVYSKTADRAVMEISENRDGITNDVEKFLRDVEAKNLEYERSEIEILSMVA